MVKACTGVALAWHVTLQVFNRTRLHKSDRKVTDFPLKNTLKNQPPLIFKKLLLNNHKLFYNNLINKYNKL